MGYVTLDKVLTLDLSAAFSAKWEDNYVHQLGELLAVSSKTMSVCLSLTCMVSYHNWA